jgi:hypothetical protein
MYGKIVSLPTKDWPSGEFAWYYALQVPAHATVWACRWANFEKTQLSPVKIVLDWRECAHNKKMPFNS